MKISKTTRQDILDYLKLENISWNGVLDDTAFLERIFDLKNMPSYDPRYDNATGDIWQHRHNNNDWENDWIFSDARFNSLWTEDEIFLRFLCEILHPVVRNNSRETEKLLSGFNKLLYTDGYKIVERTKIAGLPVFTARQIQNSQIEIVEPNKIKFFTNKPSAATDYPCVVLTKDNWDDYHYQTYFRLVYYESQNKTKFSNTVKILKKGEKTTKIQDAFNKLASDFCSLGQTID